MPKHTMTAEEARQFFSYNSETGDLVWRVSPNNRVPVGHVVRAKDGGGYYHVKFRGVVYKVHRVAWLITTGSWPVHFIDHINRNRADNRIANLREATPTENQFNKDSPYRGVSYRKSRNAYIARITVGGVRRYLGYFKNMSDAERAYRQAARAYYPEFYPNTSDII